MYKKFYPNITPQCYCWCYFHMYSIYPSPVKGCGGRQKEQNFRYMWIQKVRTYYAESTAQVITKVCVVEYSDRGKERVSGLFKDVCNMAFGETCRQGNSMWNGSVCVPSFAQSKARILCNFLSLFLLHIPSVTVNLPWLLHLVHCSPLLVSISRYLCLQTETLGLYYSHSLPSSLQRIKFCSFHIAMIN